MRAYQQRYLDNLQKIVALTGLSQQMPRGDADSLAQHEARIAGIRAVVAENTAMLRQHLFPVLDDIVSVDEAEVADLTEFAGKLAGVGANQPDLVLQYSIHSALVTYARKRELRDMLIRELYATGLALFYMQEIITRCGKVRYRWKMGLMFGEAASYIKQYDEINDPEIRGYIHRSMGNLALSNNGPTLEDAHRKLGAVRRSLQILTDPAYHAKTPSLPWDRYIYMSHQERSTVLNALRAGISDPLILQEVMESAQYVRERQEEDCRKKGTKPMVRWRMGYEAALYHCGIRPLNDLLHWMETVYLERDERDYSEDGIYYNISIPAVYAEYLSSSGTYRTKKKEVLSYMYRRAVHYVRAAPEHKAGEQMLNALLSLLQSFVEYPDGIQEKDLLLQLLVCRHPDAYVSFRLTGQITRMMAERALRERPGLLLGVLGCTTAEQLQTRQADLLLFAYESGLLHDVGVLPFDNMLRRTGRSWMEEEREMYQYHVYAGEAILSRSESTRSYALSALGHHRYFDGSGGYPTGYDRSANPNQAVTDLVSAAAYLVRLTDNTGYQNRPALTLSQALDAVCRYAGTRFSPAAAGLLAELAPELETCLQAGRAQAYEEAFRLLKG